MCELSTGLARRLVRAARSRVVVDRAEPASARRHRVVCDTQANQVTRGCGQVRGKFLGRTRVSLSTNCSLEGGIALRTALRHQPFQFSFYQ